MSRSSRQAGFTLVEVLVVAFILVLLATLVLPAVFGRMADARVSTAKTQVEGFEHAVRMFQLDTGRLPSAAEGLRVLIPPPPAGVRNYHPDGYLGDVEVPVDPWGNEYAYLLDGNRFTIASFGPDGVPSEDDITNWTKRERRG